MKPRTNWPFLTITQEEYIETRPMSQLISSLFRALTLGNIHIHNFGKIHFYVAPSVVQSGIQNIYNLEES